MALSHFGTTNDEAMPMYFGLLKMRKDVTFVVLLFFANAMAIKFNFWSSSRDQTTYKPTKPRMKSLGSPRIRLIDLVMSDDEDQQQPSLNNDGRPVRYTHEDIGDHL